MHIYLNPWTYLQSYWDSFVDSCKLDFRFFHQNQRVSGIWRNSRREWQWPRQWREWWRRWGQLESTSLWAHSRRRWWSTRLWSQDKSFDRNSVPDKREVLEGLHKNRKLNHMKSSNTMYKNEIWLHLFQNALSKMPTILSYLWFSEKYSWNLLGNFVYGQPRFGIVRLTLRICHLEMGASGLLERSFLSGNIFSLQCRMRIWLGLFTPV